MKTNILTVLIAAMAAQLANAATRQSNSYGIAAESAAAGGRISSARYIIDGTLGEFGGPAIASDGLITAGSGFSSQLTEVTNLAVSPTPSALNEGATAQLTATARLDDGTFANVTTTGARWSLLSGPLTVNSTNGTVRAANVYQNTSATAQASYLGRSASTILSIVNTGNDDFGAYSGDGLDDAWQVQFFDLNNPNAGPTADPDRDGQDNRFEFMAGTSPTNAASRFNLQIVNVTNQPERKAITFEPRLGTRNYQVEYRTNLATGAFVPLTGALSSDIGQQRTVTDLSATNGTRYYRVRITSP